MEKNIWKNFLERAFMKDKAPLWKNVKIIWKNFLEMDFYKKRGYPCRKVENFG